VRSRLNNGIELFAGRGPDHSGRRELTGPDRDLLQETATLGRAYTIGAAVKPCARCLERSPRWSPALR